MTDELQAIVDGQRRWASRAEVEVLQSGHTADLSANLFRPLDAASERELAAARGRPLGDDAKPGDLQLLDSTLALVVNAFAAHRDAPTKVAAALAGGSAATLRLSPALDETTLPAEIHALFEGSGRPTAVSAAYAEPYRSPRPEREPANRVPAEWLEDEAAWKTLPGCRGLALDLRHTPRRYEHLAVAKLLATAVALNARFGARSFRLVHVWHDVPGTAAERHAREIERFRMRVGGEIDFQSVTLRQVLEPLAADPGTDRDWLAYMHERYARTGSPIAC